MGRVRSEGRSRDYLDVGPLAFEEHVVVQHGVVQIGVVEGSLRGCPIARRQIPPTTVDHSRNSRRRRGNARCDGTAFARARQIVQGRH